MRKIAHGFQVVFKSVEGGDKRQRYEARSRCDRLIHVLKRDAAVARLDPGHFAARFLKFAIEGEGPEEMKRICHDFCAGFRQVQ